MCVHNPTYIDPIVLAHARVLLATDPLTLAVSGDIREPDTILADPAVRSHLDFARPVAVLFLAVLHFVREDPAGIVASFRDALAPGSYVVVSHVADLPDSGNRPDRAAATREAAARYDALAGPFTLRSPEQITRLFTGFRIEEPGVVPANLWRPTRGRRGAPIPILAGIGRFPDHIPQRRPWLRPAFGAS